MDNQTILFWAFLLAAPFVGSFLGTLVTRLPAGEPVLFARSRCDACQHVITPGHLIPVASWIVLSRRCAYCAAPLSAFYPGIEMTALLVALWAAATTTGFVFAASCILGWTLLALAAVDWRTQLLPDGLTLFLLAAGFLATAFIDPGALIDRAIAAAAGFASLAGLMAVYRLVRKREGMGLGDAKLFAALGTWVSLAGLPSVLFLACMLGLLYMLTKSLSGARLNATDRLPFGSFLAVSTWLIWLYGPLVPS